MVVLATDFWTPATPKSVRMLGVRVAFRFAIVGHRFFYFRIYELDGGRFPQTGHDLFRFLIRQLRYNWFLHLLKQRRGLLSYLLDLDDVPAELRFDWI